MCTLNYRISSAGMHLHVTTRIRMNCSLENGAAWVGSFICLSGVVKFKWTRLVSTYKRMKFLPYLIKLEIVIHNSGCGVLGIMGCNSHTVFWRCSTMHKRCQLYQRPGSAFPQVPFSVTEQHSDISAFPRRNSLLHYLPYPWALQADAVFAVHKITFFLNFSNWLTSPTPYPVTCLGEFLGVYFLLYFADIAKVTPMSLGKMMTNN